MADEWIKMRSALHDSPRVRKIARLTGLDRFGVIGRLHRLWCWLDQTTEDGKAVHAEAQDIDEIVEQDGFCSALIDIGWVEPDKDRMSFVRFEEHNGKTAKKRANDAKRASDKRQNQTGTGDSPPDVADSSQGSRRKPQKRRTKCDLEQELEQEPDLLSDAAHPPPRRAAKPAFSPEFEAWWKSYPVRQQGARRGDKTAAWESWQHLGPGEHPRITEATARLVGSGDLPKDAQRFLRPERGGKTPVYETWLEDTGDAPVVARAEDSPGATVPSSPFEASRQQLKAEAERLGGPARRFVEFFPNLSEQGGWSEPQLRELNETWAKNAEQYGWKAEAFNALSRKLRDKGGRFAPSPADVFKAIKAKAANDYARTGAA